MQNPNPNAHIHIPKTSILGNASSWACIGAFLLGFYIYIKSIYPLFPYFH